MNIDNKTYDKLKWVTLDFLPAIATLIGTVGLALNWEYTEITVIIVTAITAAIGRMLKISNNKYLKDHDIVIEKKDIE